MSNVERRINGYMNEEDSSSRALGIGNLTLLVNIVAPPPSRYLQLFQQSNGSNTPVRPFPKFQSSFESSATLFHSSISQFYHCIIPPLLHWSIAPTAPSAPTAPIAPIASLLQLFKWLKCSIAPNQLLFLTYFPPPRCGAALLPDRLWPALLQGRRERVLQQTDPEDCDTAETEAKPRPELQTHLHLRVPQVNDTNRQGQEKAVRGFQTHRIF